MIELEKIKKYIEFSISSDDIGVKNRDYNLSMARYIYFSLAKKYTKYSLKQIGGLVNRNHSTVLHGLKKIKYEYTKDKFVFNLYNNIDNKLKSDLKDDNPLDFLEFKDRFQIYNHYKSRHILHTEKYHNVINKLMKHNNDLKQKFSVLSKKLFNEISTLDSNELIELEKRIEIFIKVKKHFKTTNKTKINSNQNLCSQS